MGIFNGLFGGSSGRGPDAVGVPIRDVGHRVFVERPPDAVWPHLVAPAPGAELGVDCVRVLALPRPDPGALPEFATVWRRSNGRLWAGLATVLAMEPRERVVVRAADGAQPLDLVTTLEPLDHGCVVEQRLDGVTPGDRVAEFATAWLARGLLGLKADVEGSRRDRPSDRAGHAAPDQPQLGGLEHAGGLPLLAPVSEQASLEVRMPPEQLWAYRSSSATESLVKPTAELVIRVELADAGGVEHVLAVHRRDDGRRGVSVSLVVDASSPTRIVERDLTAPHESDLATTIAASGEGSVLTETLTAWLPGAAGRVVDTSGPAAALRARLELLKQLAELGTAPQRDPRTGFLPPVPSGTPGPPDHPTLAGLPERPAVPSSVLMPPPHVAAPASGYSFGTDWSTWGDVDFFSPDDVTWW